MKRINDYCRCDVLDTYFVFLRTQLLVGAIGLADEDTLIQDAHQWLESKSDEFPVYGEYLESCRPWTNPWLPAPETTPNEPDSDSEIQRSAEENPTIGETPNDEGPTGPEKETAELRNPAPSPVAKPTQRNARSGLAELALACHALFGAIHATLFKRDVIHVRCHSRDLFLPRNPFDEFGDLGNRQQSIDRIVMSPQIFFSRHKMMHGTVTIAAK